MPPLRQRVREKGEIELSFLPPFKRLFPMSFAIHK